MPKSPRKRRSPEQQAQPAIDDYRLDLVAYSVDRKIGTFNKRLELFLKKALALPLEQKLDTLKKAKTITEEQQLVEAVTKIDNAILIAEAEAQAKAADEAAKEQAAAAQAASNYTALGVSAIIGIIASIYSQTLQNMLFAISSCKKAPLS